MQRVEDEFAYDEARKVCVGGRSPTAPLSEVLDGAVAVGGLDRGSGPSWGSALRRERPARAAGRGDSREVAPVHMARTNAMCVRSTRARLGATGALIRICSAYRWRYQGKPTCASPSSGPNQSTIWGAATSLDSRPATARTTRADQDLTDARGGAAGGDAPVGECPLPLAHDRYSEAHWHLHQMLDNYHHPMTFRTLLNAFLHAMNLFRHAPRRPGAPRRERVAEGETRTPESRPNLLCLL